MKEIQIGSRRIGGENPVYIVAEAGINHNGDMTLAKRMVDVAADCGVDAVKFQLFKAEEIVQDRSVEYEYESQGKKIRESQYEMFKRFELSPEQMAEIADHCRKRGLVFFATPQNATDLESLLRIGVPVIKVGSDDLTHLSMLQKYASYGIPMILSSGMSYLYEVDEAIRAVLPVNDQLVLLHCVSLYPTAPHDAHMLKIPTLRQNYPDVVIGYSDHSRGTTLCVMAVTLGAKVYERHFTLDKTIAGPDQAFSADPDELKRVVQQIREAEAALGESEIKPTLREESMRLLCRRSVVADRDLQAGDTLTEGNLALRRPGNGLSPKVLPLLFGRRVKRPIQKGEPINPKDLID